MLDRKLKEQIYYGNNQPKKEFDNKAFYIFMAVIVGFALIVALISITSNSNTHYEQSKQERNLDDIVGEHKATKDTQRDMSEEKTYTETEKHALDSEQSAKTENTITNKSVPQNKFRTAYEYTMFVKQMLQNSYSSKYSVDCTILVTPQEKVTILDNSFNADVAYNFLQSKFLEIPKYIDAEGKTVPIVIEFSGHEIYSVGFQEHPKTIKSNTSNNSVSGSSAENNKKLQRSNVKNTTKPQHLQKPNTTVNKAATAPQKTITNVQVNKPKTDLQKSTDDFFE